MAVDQHWLAQIRAKNRAKFNMPPLPNGGLGYVSSQDLVGAINQEREARTASIHRGRFERQDPQRPAEGSVESIVQAMGPVHVPPPSQPSRTALYVGGAIVIGIVGLTALALRRG